MASVREIVHSSSKTVAGRTLFVVGVCWWFSCHILPSLSELLMFSIQNYVTYDVHSSSLKKIKSKSVSIKIVRKLLDFFFSLEKSVFVSRLFETWSLCSGDPVLLC
jgi:phage-related holin